MAHAQKPYFLFRRNGRVHLNRQGRHFSRLLAAEVCASAVVMLETPCSVVMWRALVTHSIRHFPLHLPFCAPPCAITFQLQFTSSVINCVQAALNPLNAELNPICYLLALLGAHYFLHVSMMRVKLLILRLLMSYIYLWSTYSWCF